MLAKISIALLLGVTASVALPFSLRRDGVTALTADQISSFKPYALLARAGYCPASQTATWSCGAPCADVPGFIPYATGGDGTITPFWYVGYHPALQSVVVSNQGTDPSKIVPLLTDGFQDAQKRSATAKLAAIQKAMSEQASSLVTLTGHSLGGAISLIDALYLSINLPAATLKVVTHGMPRVGNPEFAALIDSRINDLAHINNEKDIVPIVPGRSLGFAHPSGEKHIIAPGDWVACAGQDNTDSQCTIGTVSNILVGNLSNHDGPYEGVVMGDCDN